VKNTSTENKQFVGRTQYTLINTSTLATVSVK